MTQYGSFPDRPRGRRAQHGSEPINEREFPDLEPIRDGRLSESDNRGLPPDAPVGRQGRHGNARHGNAAQEGSAGWGGQYEQRQHGGQRHEEPVRYGTQSHQGQAYQSEQSLGQPQGSQQHQAQRPPAGRVSEPDEPETDDPMEAFSDRWARRGADTPRDRRRRRLWLFGGGGVVAVAVAVTAYLLVGNNSNSASVGLGSLVTSFLPGEIQKVPDACKAVSAATLSQYLPGGQPEIAAPPLNGGQDSQCTWTLDSAPTYRVIEVQASAFSPSGLASGNGSATNAAIDAYANDRQAMLSPAANSGQPKAVITDLPNIGTVAFSATQVFHVNGATTYKATVTVRYHNVIVTAVVNGLEHAETSKGTYGPVSMSTLIAAARQVATETVTAVH